MAAGLGVVISECGIANLDLDKDFISVIPDSKINDIEYIEKHVIMNREYSINHRQEIRDYAKKFDWPEIFNKYYFPSIKEVIDEKLS